MKEGKSLINQFRLLNQRNKIVRENQTIIEDDHGIYYLKNKYGILEPVVLTETYLNQIIANLKNFANGSLTPEQYIAQMAPTSTTIEPTTISHQHIQKKQITGKIDLTTEAEVKPGKVLTGRTRKYKFIFKDRSEVQDGQDITKRGEYLYAINKQGKEERVTYKQHEKERVARKLAKTANITMTGENGITFLPFKKNDKTIIQDGLPITRIKRRYGNGYKMFVPGKDGSEIQIRVDLNNLLNKIRKSALTQECAAVVNVEVAECFANVASKESSLPELDHSDRLELPEEEKPMWLRGFDDFHSLDCDTFDPLNFEYPVSPVLPPPLDDTPFTELFTNIPIQKRKGDDSDMQQIQAEMPSTKKNPMIDLATETEIKEKVLTGRARNHYKFIFKSGPDVLDDQDITKRGQCLYAINKHGKEEQVTYKQNAREKLIVKRARELAKTTNITMTGENDFKFLTFDKNKPQHIPDGLPIKRTKNKGCANDKMFVIDEDGSLIRIRVDLNHLERKLQQSLPKKTNIDARVFNNAICNMNNVDTDQRSPFMENSPALSSVEVNPNDLPSLSIVNEAQFETEMKQPAVEEFFPIDLDPQSPRCSNLGFFSPKSPNQINFGEDFELAPISPDQANFEEALDSPNPFNMTLR